MHKRLVLFLMLLACLAATKIRSSPAAPIFSEVTRKTVGTGDHQTTIIRVRPPVLPKAPAPPTTPPLTAEQKAAEAAFYTKPWGSLNVTATVYVGTPTYTELRWRNEAGTTEYQAWSNADFRYLTHISSIERPAMIYSWFPFIMDAYAWSDLPADQKPAIPGNLKLSKTQAEYAVETSAKGLASEEVTLVGLDYLHAYYQLHYTELKAAYEKTQADQAAQAEQLRLNPPKKPDTTLRFWIPNSK